MLYFSTRDASHSGRPFSEIVLEGLAPDGGLYIPQTIPQLDDQALRNWCHKTYPEITTELLRLYAPELESEIHSSFEQLVHNSTRNFRSPEVIPLKKLGNSSIYVGELFHGPTYAFKDVALQFLGQVFQGLLQAQNRKLTLLGATSGDTGGAAIYGVRGMDNIQLTILHPHRAVSEVQRKQMCSVLDHNICNIAIQGNFDNCQSMVKEIMERSKCEAGMPQIGAINSINWGRILAQISYYFWLYFRLIACHSGIQLGDTVRFVVPTGNFGNVLAGYFAKRMGLPIQLVAATNQNDILHRCISHNDYKAPDKLQPSFAPAMDIIQPSNFERYLYYLFADTNSNDSNNNQAVCQKLRSFIALDKETGPAIAAPRQLSDKHYAQLQTDFSSHHTDDEGILEAIFQCHNEYGYTLDPHTACAYASCVRLPQDMPSVCLATAHPAKFPEVYEALGRLKADAPLGQLPQLQIPAGLDFTDMPERYCVLEHDTEALLEYLQRNVWN